MKTSPNIVKSFSFNQHAIIRGITQLHLGNERITLDPCYGYGQFYKPDDILEPSLAYDISLDTIDRVEHRVVYQYDATDLSHLENDSIASIMFDPPFLQTTGKGSILKERFGSYPSMSLLWEFYSQALLEFCRILMPDGKLVVKMQNTVMSGRQWWSVNYVRDSANRFGLELVDEFILGAKHTMKQWNLKSQKHARKHHSFFLVFKKEK